MHLFLQFATCLNASPFVATVAFESLGLRSCASLPHESCALACKILSVEMFMLDTYL